jgi:thymidylate synthase ThyX
MPDYADAKHRPHAVHTGEMPSTDVVRGPESLVVTLDNWPQIETNMFPSLYDSLVSNWGDDPSRTVDRACGFNGGYLEHVKHINSWEHKTGWCRLEPDQQAYVEMCFAGKTLQQALERFTFSFCVDGCSRAETHQIVRTRVGAGFMQHGGRDNDWRHRRWTMPETITRACEADEAKRGAARIPEGPGGPYPTVVTGREVCISDWTPIESFINQQDRANDLRGAIQAYLDEGKALYAALVDAGIPWQDARRVLWMGTQTYIHCDYNYVALKGVLGNRLEHIMDWEVNCVAQLMQREVNMKCPPIFGRYLGSHSDMQKRAAFAGLESWPADGKWPNPYERCANCENPKDHPIHGVSTETEPSYLYHEYRPVDKLPRQHTARQMPFWVLTPEAMRGGAIEWIATNGTYPHDLLYETGVAYGLESEDEVQQRRRGRMLRPRR